MKSTHLSSFPNNNNSIFKIWTLSSKLSLASSTYISNNLLASTTLLYSNIAFIISLKDIGFMSSLSLPNLSTLLFVKNSSRMTIVSSMLFLATHGIDTLLCNISEYIFGDGVTSNLRDIPTIFLVSQGLCVLNAENIIWLKTIAGSISIFSFCLISFNFKTIPKEPFFLTQ